MPFLKALAAASALSLVSVPVNPAVPSGRSGIPPTEHPEVLKVQCIQGSGSAFRISKTRALSVAHVTDLAGCFINNRPFDVIYKHGDFSILSLPDAGTAKARIDCNGYVKGRTYEAVGYARGRDTLTLVGGLVPNGNRWKSISGNLVILEGVFTFIPGQSGSWVRDSETKKVVGLVNMYDARGGLSASIELKDTVICA